MDIDGAHLQFARYRERTRSSARRAIAPSSIALRRNSAAVART